MQRVLGRHPVDRAFDLAAAVLGAAARRGVVAAVQLDDVARGILHHALAFHDIAVAQPHFAARLQPMELARRVLHEVLALDEDLL